MLGQPTQDVLVVIEYAGGVLVEVQFTFKSVMLMKMFSHAAYSVTRIDTKSESACMNMLVGAPPRVAGAREVSGVSAPAPTCGIPCHGTARLRA